MKLSARKIKIPPNLPLLKARGTFVSLFIKGGKIRFPSLLKRGQGRFLRRLLLSLLAFLILAPLILLILRPSSASAAWFDDNYAYRQKFSFTHNADILSQRRIRITSAISVGDF